MTGGELFSLIQQTAGFEEKFGKIVDSEEFNGGAIYQLRGYDIAALHKICKEMELFLRNIEIGGKACCSQQL